MGSELAVGTQKIRTVHASGLTVSPSISDYVRGFFAGAYGELLSLNDVTAEMHPEQVEALKHADMNVGIFAGFPVRVSDKCDPSTIKLMIPSNATSSNGEPAPDLTVVKVLNLGLPLIPESRK